MFLSGISIVCFGTSYLVTLALEISRLFFRLPVRLLVMLAFAAMGLALHTIYLALRAEAGMASGDPLSSWHDWYLLAAWILAAAYLIIAISRPQTLVGLFMLPVVLALVGVAALFDKNTLFPHDQALALWGLAHGLMLLLGTVTVSLGFVAGLMYLVQSWRLKQKLPPQAGFKLPSLEWLQSINKQSLGYSSCFIALGLVAGIVMNVIKYRGAGQPVPWTDSVVLSSAALLVWLIVATIFEWVYKPAQQGRKVAYLTVASFVFLALVMAILFAGGSQHAAPRVSGAEHRGQESGVGSQESVAVIIAMEAAP
jgi:hypothetical protein